MPKGDAIYFPDVQSDIDMKNTWKFINYPPSSTILSIAQTIYVDAVNGSSSGQRGTTSAFQTLAQAIAVVQAGDVIEVRSNLTYSGAITISVAGVTLDFRNHVVSPSVQTDSKKLIISADGCVIQNIEVNGIWDGSSTTASTGPVVSITGKRCRVDNAYIHDSIDGGLYFTGDFSDTRVENVKFKNIRLSALPANSNNATVTKADFIGITMSNIGGKGLAVYRGGAESNQVYGVNISGVYYDTIGIGTTEEAMYIHGLTDFNISNVVGVGNRYNLSLDTCVNGTVENVVTRGGLGSDQFAGIELAGCQKITVNNCIFDGLSRSGATSTASSYGGIQVSNLSAVVTAGSFTFNNVISVNWTTGLSITLATGININGGIFSGTQVGVRFTSCDTVIVTGADIRAVGTDGFDVPIAIDGGAGGSSPATGITNKDYRFIGNLIYASSGCNAEIGILSQDTHHQISGVTVKNNIKRDVQAITGVNLVTGSGGTITNVTITGNEPDSGWANAPIDLGLITTQLGHLGQAGDSNWNQITLSPPGVLGTAITGATHGGTTHQPIISFNDDQLRFYTNGQLETMRLKQGLAIGTDFSGDAGAGGEGNLFIGGTLRVGNTAAIHTSGTGSPNGVLSAPVGSTFYRTDGGSGTTFYIKESGAGNTGWVAGVYVVAGGATIASTSSPLSGDGAGNAVAATQTGTGNTVVTSVSPTLVTPVLGVAAATSVNKWILTAPSTAATLVAGLDSGTWTTPSQSCVLGFMDIPTSSHSAAWTTVITDCGKCLLHPATDTNDRTFTIDSHTNVTWRDGSAIMFENISVNNLSIAITTDTMYLAGSGTTGTRILAQYGRALARYTLATNSWIISGVGLS